MIAARADCNSPDCDRAAMAGDPGRSSLASARLNFGIPSRRLNAKVVSERVNMLRNLARLAVALFLCAPLPAGAQDRVTLGWGRLLTNDQFGDVYDRWRSGSYTMSVLSGPRWDGMYPVRFGQIIELRFRSEIIAPRTLRGAGSDDRPYAGVLSYGMHSHFAFAGGEVSAGLDIVATGPQTGVADFHDRFHARIDAPRLSDAVMAGQVPDGVHPGVTVEYARRLTLGPYVTLRPFTEWQAGVEDSLRVGSEVILGRILQGDLLLRDAPTGQLYRGIRGTKTGLALVAGADWAQMGDSVFLPAASGVQARDQRTRARIGLHWQITPRSSVFYGATWLSEEFVGQGEGQVLGSINLNIGF